MWGIVGAHAARYATWGIASGLHFFASALRWHW